MFVSFTILETEAIMSKVSFLAEAENPGADGTAVDLAGLGLPNWPLVLSVNFDVKQAVATCVVSKAPAGLLVVADVPEYLLDFYPAIGFSVADSQPNGHGGRTITAGTLQAVSLSLMPNADPTIKTIRQQLDNA